MNPSKAILILLVVTTFPTAAASTVQRDWTVPDYSFENGLCGEGSDWTCWSSTDCQWIIDAEDVWGVPAVHGENVAWLGAYCNGLANNNSFCQTLFIPCFQYDFHWMAYIMAACGTLTITLDGEVRLQHTMNESDHSYGEWQKASETWGSIDTSYEYGGYATFCIEWTACGGDLDGDGWPDTLNDSVIIDVIQGDGCEVPVQTLSFSAVKSLY